MAEYQEVIKHLNRMHKQYSGDTCNEECPLCYIRGGGLNCFRWTVKHAEKAENIIMDWAKENPFKTKRMKMEEALPETQEEVFKEIPPVNFGLCEATICFHCHRDKDKACWNMEVGT